MSNIKIIKKHAIKNEKLYNLAVEKDESYICEGVVVHNCRSALIPVFIGESDTPGDYFENYEDNYKKFGTGVPVDSRKPAKGFGG